MKKMMCKFVDIVEEFFLKIFEKIGLKKITDWYRLHKEGMRYLVFGGLSTVVNILIFMFFQNLIGFSTTISNIIAWIVAVLFAYITNKLFVFYSESNNIINLLKEIASFLGARIFTLIIETIYLNITIDYFNFNSILMKIISNIIVIILNFIFSKIFIFKNNSKLKEEK